MERKRTFATEYLSPEPPWDLFLDLEAGVAARRDAEDVVKFFEGPLFGLREEEKDEEESDDVETGVEAVGPSGAEGGENSR